MGGEIEKSWICTSVWLQQRSSSRDHTGAAFCWVSPGVCWEWLKAEFPLPVTEAGVGSGWDLEPAKAGREENGISPELLSSALTHRTNPSPAQGQPGHSSGPGAIPRNSLRECPAQPGQPQNVPEPGVPAAGTGAAPHSCPKIPAGKELLTPKLHRQGELPGLEKNPKIFDLPGFASQELEEV